MSGNASPQLKKDQLPVANGIILLMAVWTNPIAIGQLNDFCHVQQSVRELWLLLDLLVKSITTVVVLLTRREAVIDSLLGSDHLTVVS